MRRPRLAISNLLGLSGAAAPHLESLEPRTHLSGTPLPDIALLENPQNPVVRMETNVGDFDIELFFFAGSGGRAVSNTVTNFINYIVSGRLDETFFHRAVEGFVLQGGGFSFRNGSGVTTTTTDDPIAIEAGRSNLERTLAMARTNQPVSATSQFFINYVDNPGLNPGGFTPEGYAVFGRVIQGWSVIQAIQALTVRDFFPSDDGSQGDQDNIDGINDPALTTSQFASNFGTVPTTSAYSQASGVRENALLTLVNAELIKPIGNSGFFAQEVAHPEGFRSPFSTETLELFNPNGTLAKYQVIARYEQSVPGTTTRDVVIASGDLDANQKLEIDLANPGAGRTAVREETPYSLIVQTSLPTSTTNPLPIAAASNRRDFGGVVGDSFYITTGAATGGATDPLKTWDFPRVERADSSREFLSWINLSSSIATITAFFYSEGSDVPETLRFTLRAHSRGGAEVHSLGLAVQPPDANGLPAPYSVRVTCDQPIVAALSDWDLPVEAAPTNPPPGLAPYTPAFGGLGIPGGGASQAWMSDLVFRDSSTNAISLFNPNSIPVVVTLNYWTTARAAGSPPNTQTIVVLGNSRKEVPLDLVRTGTVAGERFSASYAAGVLPIAAAFTSLLDTSRGRYVLDRNDGTQSNFATHVAPNAYFADAFIDPSRDSSMQSEVLSIFNPFADSAVNLTVTVTALFSDQTTLTLATQSIASLRRFDLALDASSALRAKAAADPAFRSYALIITGSATGTSQGTIATAGVASLIRRDTATGRAVAHNPILHGTLLSLSDPIFQPTSGGTPG